MNVLSRRIPEPQTLCNSLMLAVLLAHAAALAVSPLQAAGSKALSPYAYKALTAIQQQMEQDRNNAALAALEKLLNESGLSEYEQAVMQQMLGYVQVSREVYPAAIKAFEHSLSLQQLPESTEQHLRYNLGQLYLGQGQTNKAISILESWFERETSPTAQAHVLLAQALAQKKQYRKAVPLLEKANGLSDKPHAEWYEALVAMHYELQSYRDCVPLLKKMIRLFPKHTRYWQQLGGVYMAMNDQAAALSALELAFRLDVLTSEQELIQLAQLYLSTGVPYKAARLIEQQIKVGKISNTPRHRELLAHAWTSARERKQAISALERAVQDEAKPELRLTLAQWYAEAENWHAVIKILAPFQGKENNYHTLQARLLLGIAHFELGNTDAARNAFQLARQFPKTSQPAKQWLEFLDSLSANNL
jgi:tetratricopeptide (TPR) repeat protein